jgi:hypothetical protein
MVKMMLGITTFILINSVTHPTPYQSNRQHNSYPRDKKKNSLEPLSAHKKEHVETIHDSSVKKNSKFVGNND